MRGISTPGSGWSVDHWGKEPKYGVRFNSARGKSSQVGENNMRAGAGTHG